MTQQCWGVKTTLSKNLMWSIPQCMYLYSLYLTAYLVQVHVGEYLNAMQ